MIRKVKSATKLASLTTSSLKIYEDEPDGSNATDVPAVNEPTSHVLHQVTLNCFGCNYYHCEDGFQTQVERDEKTRCLNCTNYSETGGTRFDLLFGSTVDEAKFYAWNKAVQEAEHLSAKKTNTFSQV